MKDEPRYKAMPDKSQKTGFGSEMKEKGVWYLKTVVSLLLPHH